MKWNAQAHTECFLIRGRKGYEQTVERGDRTGLRRWIDGLGLVSR